VIVLEIIIQRLAKEILRITIKSVGIAVNWWCLVYQTMQLVEAFNVGREPAAVLFRDFDLVR